MLPVVLCFNKPNSWLLECRCTELWRRACILGPAEGYMQVAEEVWGVGLEMLLCAETLRTCELLTCQCPRKVLVIVFLERVITYIMASVFVSPNKSFISDLVLVCNFQGSQRVLHRWHLKGSLLIMLKLNSNRLYVR